MTDREKAIVMAYTGVAMLTGDKLDLFYQYLEEILGRPVFTHELADNKVFDEIKEKSKADFVNLCKETTEFRYGRWIELDQDVMGEKDLMCSRCGGKDKGFYLPKFCKNCGAEMYEV